MNYLQSKPLVSVVMPTYNRSDLLSRAIDSILNQSFKDFEFIIIDDGSTDNTEKIIKKYAALDKRIKYVKNEINKGIGFSRNRGNDLAQGKYIIVMDSDDFSLPYRIEKSVVFMDENPDVDAMSGQLLSIGKDIKSEILFNGKEYNVIKNNFKISLMFFNTFWNVSSIFRRDFIQKNKIKYNVDYISAEDYDFWKQFVMANGRLVTITDPLVLVRKHLSNSKEYYEAMIKNSEKIHYDLISRFFDPSKNEIKFKYSIKERCSILEKAMLHNTQKNVMEQSDLKEYYISICPPDIDNSLYLKHLNWEDFLYPVDNKGNYIRWSVNIPAQIEKKQDRIVVIWNGYPKETFLLDETGVYRYLSDDWIRIQHINWTDYILFLPENKFCRFSVNDCGDVLKRNLKEVQIRWNNTNYPVETFFLNQQTKLYHLK